MVSAEVLHIGEPVLDIVDLGFVHAFAPVSSFSHIVRAPCGTVMVSGHHVVDEVVRKIEPVGKVIQKRNLRIGAGVERLGKILTDIVLKGIPDIGAAIVSCRRTERRIGVVGIDVADLFTVGIIYEIALCIMSVERTDGTVTVYETGNRSLVGTCVPPM